MFYESTRPRLRCMYLRACACMRMYTTIISANQCFHRPNRPRQFHARFTVPRRTMQEMRWGVRVHSGAHVIDVSGVRGCPRAMKSPTHEAADKIIGSSVWVCVCVFVRLVRRRRLHWYEDLVRTSLNGHCYIKVNTTTACACLRHLRDRTRRPTASM